MTEPTRISTDVDLEASGRHTGVLRLPHSDNEHAFGVVPIPIAVIGGGPGPTALLVAGTHGDEYEGQISLRKLIGSLDPGRLEGRLIVLPAVNFLAAQAGARCWPGDGVNMNRIYPGDPDQTPTGALAHYVEHHLLPRCDWGIDLHSGGLASEFLPCVYLRKAGDAGLMQRKVALTDAFAAPLTVVVEKTSDNRSLIAAADRQGVAMIATELRGMGSVSVDALTLAEQGLRAMLVATGMLDEEKSDEPRAPSRYVRLPDARSFVMAQADGLFEPRVTLGARVSEGDVAGWIHSHRGLDVAPMAIRFSAAGQVVCRRVPAPVSFGDYLFSVATEVARTSLIAG